MAMLCSICPNPKIKAMEKAYVRGEPVRKIAKRFKVSAPSLRRHLLKCMKRRVQSALVRHEVKVGQTHLDRFAELVADAQRIKAACEKQGDFRSAISAIRELTRIIELEAKMAGELKSETNVDVNIANVIQSPEWIVMRERIVNAVQCDACRERVAVALLQGGE